MQTIGFSWGLLDGYMPNETQFETYKECEQNILSYKEYWKKDFKYQIFLSSKDNGCVEILYFFPVKNT